MKQLLFFGNCFSNYYSAESFYKFELTVLH